MYQVKSGRKKFFSQPALNLYFSKYEKFCDGKCISRSIPCMGKCENDTESRYNLPVLCMQENLCKSDIEPCGGRCLNPALPTLALTNTGLDPVCINLEETECIPEGPLWDHSSYMCNGICIPAYIPCNNTCPDNILWRTNRREELFGPVQCQDFEETGQLRELWLKEENVLFLKTLMDFQGFCLPGTMVCNETCSIDPRRALMRARAGPVKFECVEACHRTREWPCNGTCIEDDEPCGDSCRFDHFRCNNGKCIEKYKVCDGDNESWNDCEDGEDEEDCPDNCTPKSDYDFSNDRILFDENGIKICKTDLMKSIAQESCEGKILCDEDRICIELYKINNGENDCEDGLDENVTIAKIPKVEGVTYRFDYENQEEYSLENRIVYYNSYQDHLENYLWICDGRLQNISAPCHGECNSYKSWKLCAGENGTGYCVPNEENCPNKTEGTLISSSGKECRFRHR